MKRTANLIKSRSAAPNVAILNMASALRPGGRFLDGGNTQEEFLCSRTTLYSTLCDSFYSLPDVGAVWSPDVLVFRDNDGIDLARHDRYFVDVISSSMFRFPSNTDSAVRAFESCSCGVSYCDRHRDLVLRKMKAVMRIAQQKGVRKLVLGAWGCGNYGNPVREVAKAWRKVIAGAPRQRRPNAECWQGISEVVFAVPDRAMVKEFEMAFEDILAPETPARSPSETHDDSGFDHRMITSDAQLDQLILRIAETELQIDQTSSWRLKAQHRERLSGMKRDLNAGMKNKNAVGNEVESESETNETTEEESGSESFVMAGVPASDGEEQTFYNFDDLSSASSSSPTSSRCGRAGSETYEFQPPRHSRHTGAREGRAERQSTGTEHDSADELAKHRDGHRRRHHRGSHVSVSSRARFDPDSGWFQGSVDELSRELMLGRCGAGGKDDGDSGWSRLGDDCLDDGDESPSVLGEDGEGSLRGRRSQHRRAAVGSDDAVVLSEDVPWGFFPKLR